MLIKTNAIAETPSIEMTPIIDMVFLLLIFFLVATTFHQAEREMQIALPFASSGEPLSSLLKELVVNVDGDGKIIVSGQTVSSGQLGDLIKEAIAVNPEQKVTVRGDRQTAYSNIMNVLDICKANGIQEPYLDTVLVE